jgi:hypothetical protein
LVINKLHICKEWHVQPSEIDKLVFYEYEWILDEINKVQKEQQKHQEEEEKKYANMKNPSSMFKSPKMPTMPSFSMPRL